MSLCGEVDSRKENIELALIDKLVAALPSLAARRRIHKSQTPKIPRQLRINLESPKIDSKSVVSAVSAVAARRNANTSASSPASTQEDVLSVGPSRLQNPNDVRFRDRFAERPRKRRKKGSGLRTNVEGVEGGEQTQAAREIDDNGGAMDLETWNETKIPEVEDQEVVSIASALDQVSDDASFESFDDRFSDDAITFTPTGANRQLSTFTPSPSNILHETPVEWAVRLGRKDTLAVVGQYDIWVRKGAITISGAILRASSNLYSVYAPSTHAIPVIRPSLDPYGSGPQTSEVTLLSCGSGLRSLKRVSTRFGRIWNGPSLGAAADTSRPLHRSFINLGTTADDTHERPLRPLEQPKDWSHHLNRIAGRAPNDATRILISGPKGSGKSTFCRLLSNSLLSSADQVQSEGHSREYGLYFIDLDPGQPEFSPPGDISLVQVSSPNLGVPYAHPRQCPEGGVTCIRSHHIGSASPKEDPKHYLDCALDLLNFYDRLTKHKKATHLVINSFGWIQGTGLTILKGLIQNSSPTKVLYLSTTGPDEVNVTLASASEQVEAAFHKLESQPFSDGMRIASELRAMQAQSYFHLVKPEVGKLRWDCRPLTEMEALIVPYSGPKQAIAGVMVLGDERKPELLPSILDGSLVGLLLIEDDGLVTTIDSVGRDTDEGTGTEALHDRRKIHRTQAGIPYIAPHNHTTEALSPKHTCSIGQALIRSIDMKSQCFHLSTPVPSSELQLLSKEGRKIVLVRGQLDTPTWAYKEALEWEKGRLRQGPKKGRDIITGAAAEDISQEDEEMQRWSEMQPWVSVMDGDKGGTGKARKIRRDIRYRHQ